MLGTCSFQTSDFSGGVQLTVTSWESVKAAATGSSGSKPPTPVPGLGDQALTRGRGLLYVGKGARGILLVINGPHVDSLPDSGLARAETLARTILASL